MDKMKNLSQPFSIHVHSHRLQQSHGMKFLQIGVDLDKNMMRRTRSVEPEKTVTIVSPQQAPCTGLELCFM